MSNFMVTTPIYYVNDRPHVGHAYTTIAADTITRWQRLKGENPFMLTGTDEHGQKVLRAAESRKISPKEHVDELAQPFQQLWARLETTHRKFIRTTDPAHMEVVQATLQALFDRDEIYAASYEGWYSTSEERFWTEKDLVDGKCPLSGQPVEWISEQNYFFRMSKYADQLRDWIETHPEFLRPKSRRNEVLGYLKKEVGDLCISRPKKRLSWGIPLPFDKEYVTYVWFDALLNYISALGYHPDPDKRGPDFDRHWPANFQLVGKDILTTHAVYWSTMLFALGLEPAHCLYAHGWWTVEGQKMSKSIGNVVDPNLLLDCYGPDVLRYHLLREIPFGGDGDFSHEGLMVRYNADLANDLGNLAHRALSMTGKWLNGVVPTLDEPTQDDQILEALAAKTFTEFAAEIEALQFHKALVLLWELIRAGNKYVDTQEPWKLNREGNGERLAGVMRRILEVCRVAAVLMQPILPNKSIELAAKLGVSAEDLLRSDLNPAAPLAGLVAGTNVLAGEPLFPRMQELPDAIKAVLEQALGEPEAQANQKAPTKSNKTEKTVTAQPQTAETTQTVEKEEADTTPQIKIDDFAKVALKAGKVLAAEKHPKADRLLVVTVDVGEENPRTIVAGIASRYAPEELVGQTVVVVTNLKPAKLRGIKSEGMMLAAGGGAVKAMVTLSEEVAPGTIVR